VNNRLHNKLNRITIVRKWRLLSRREKKGTIVLAAALLIVITHGWWTPPVYKVLADLGIPIENWKTDIERRDAWMYPN
jgi:hypothetical protein